VSALLLVNDDLSKAAAVDPVETQQALMLRRDVLAGTPAGVTRDALRVERVGHSALLRLEARGDALQANATCAFAVARATEQARSLSQPGQEWLSEQQQRLQGELEANEEQLRSFNQEHSLLSISYEDQLGLARRNLSELEEAKRRGRPGLNAAIQDRKDQLLKLELALVERARLVRSGDSARAILKITEERLAAYELGDKLSPPLRVLEACGACAPPS
jgi:uncharacterized protein involved in exopolysaccharide biosynthesis